MEWLRKDIHDHLLDGVDAPEHCQENDETKEDADENGGGVIGGFIYIIVFHGQPPRKGRWEH